MDAEKNENIETNQQEQENDTLTFTRDELDALIQKEGDKRVSQALKTAEKKNAEKVKEAEKLAKMNEAEKFQYELEQREKAIIEKEKALALAENKNEAGKILAEKSISLDLVDFVVAEDAETMSKNISRLEKAIKKSVDEIVAKRLGGNDKERGVDTDEDMTKEKFAKLSLIEQNKLATSNPELYKALTKR